MEFWSGKHFLFSPKAAVKFDGFRQNDKFCDVSLCSENTVVKAHRVVLAAACPYFETMFTGGLKESNEELVNLHGISPDVLPLLVDFIYTGHITVNQSTAQQLMTAAHMLEMEDLLSSCASYLEKQLDPSSALMTLRLAEIYNCSELFNCTLAYTAKHWTNVIQGEEILDLPLPLFIKMLSSDRFTVESELDVVLAVMRWFEHEPVARAPHFELLMRFLPLKHVPIHELDKIWENVKDAQLVKQLNAFRAGMAASMHAQPKKHKNFYIVGGDDVYKAFKYDVYKKVWEVLASMPETREGPGVATLSDRLYVVGGRKNDRFIQSTGVVFDPATNLWSPIASMEGYRSNFGLIGLNGKLYVFGTNYIEVYDPTTDKWTKAGNMPQNRYGMSVVAYKGAAYLTGGRPPSVSSTLLRFEPTTTGSCGEWRFCAEMSHERTEHAATVLDDHLYVVGGRDENDTVLNTVARYDFATDRWEDVAPMEKARYGCAVGQVSAEGVLLVAGGLKDSSTCFMEMYIASENRWIQGPAMPQPFFNAGYAMS